MGNAHQKARRRQSERHARQRAEWRRLMPHDCESCGGRAGPEPFGMQAECGHWYCSICTGRGRAWQHIHCSDPEGTCLPVAMVQLGYLFEWLAMTDAEKRQRRADVMNWVIDDMAASLHRHFEQAERGLLGALHG